MSPASLLASFCYILQNSKKQAARREAAKAKKNRAALAAVLTEAGPAQQFSKSQSLLLLAVATKVCVGVLLT